MGIRFVKFEPSQYVLRYRRGKLIAKGAGLSFYYRTANTSIATLPISNIDVPFIFEEGTADFQTVTVQGQLVFRIVDWVRAATMLDYTTGRDGKYLSEDPQKLPQRMINAAKVLMKKRLQQINLSEAIGAGESLAAFVLDALRSGEACTQLGLEVLSLSILAIKANQETTRALEAQTREQILKAADDAVYERRNASIEQERRVQENEYNTQVSMENKKREVRETQLEAQRAVQARTNQMKEEQILAEIALEEKRKELVALAAQNAREEADAKAYALAAVMRALAGVDPAVIASLASVGMEPGKLVALAFEGIARNAERIGQLNVTPDLLREIVGE